MNKPPTKPLTKAILALICELGESTVDFVMLWSALSSRYGSAYRQGGRGYVAELKSMRGQAELKRKLSELKRRKYIAIYRTGKKFSVALTNKGRSYNEARSWHRSPLHKPGWFTVVVFDIPEQMSFERRRWRALLRAGGFSKLQQSVWVSELDSYDMVASFVRKVKVGRWINVFQAINFLGSPKR